MVHCLGFAVFCSGWVAIKSVPGISYARAGHAYWAILVFEQGITFVRVAHWPSDQSYRTLRPGIGRPETPLMEVGPKGTWQRIHSFFGVGLTRGMVIVYTDSKGEPLSIVDNPNKGRQSMPLASTEVFVPYWLILVLSSTLCIWPARLLIIKLQRIRRARRRQCLYCGYDLRGSTDVCAECGGSLIREQSHLLKTQKRI
jgi:hypothetical protein